MTKIFNFALKIKGGGRESGRSEVLRRCHPLKFGTCTNIWLNPNLTGLFLTCLGWGGGGVPPYYLRCLLPIAAKFCTGIENQRISSNMKKFT